MHIKSSTFNKKYLRSPWAVGSCFIRLGVCGAVLLVLAVGCGKKAPPVAPKPRPLTAVTDLKGVLRNEQVRLTWTHRPDNRYAKFYLVLRAQREMSRPACGDCPRVFQKVDTIAIPGSLRDKKTGAEFLPKPCTRLLLHVQCAPCSRFGRPGTGLQSRDRGGAGCGQGGRERS